MEPLYKPVTLDERARTYLNQISVERTRQTNRFALQAFYSFRRYHVPAPLAWKDMTFEVLAEFAEKLTAFLIQNPPLVNGEEQCDQLVANGQGTKGK